jgi:hypothetical protein
VIDACPPLPYDFDTGNPAGIGESSEMSDAIGTLGSTMRPQFAFVADLCRQAEMPVEAASLAGARSSLSMQAHDPGGGPGV